MNAGELRQEIAYESPSGDRLPSGGFDPNGYWTVFCRLRAKIEPQGGSEMFGAGVFNPEATHKITHRYHPGLLTSMRINFKGRLFNVLNINNVEERNIEMNVLCSEGRSHGVVA